MTFVIPDDLAPEVYPLAWLVGRWEGHGVLEYPDIPATDVLHRIDFTHDGGPYLEYRAAITVMGPDGEPGQVWSVETGFWRVSPEVPEGIELEEYQHPIEVVLTDASGYVSVYVGAVGNGRVDLGTDLMARTASAPEVAGATRLYGHVNGELMWAWDLAAFGKELQSYLSGRLSRIEASPVDDTGAEA